MVFIVVGMTSFHFSRFLISSTKLGQDTPASTSVLVVRVELKSADFIKNMEEMIYIVNLHGFSIYDFLYVMKSSTAWHRLLWPPKLWRQRRAGSSAMSDQSKVQMHVD